MGHRHLTDEEKLQATVDAERKRLARFQMTGGTYLSHTRDYDGICLACGETTCGGVEPDAEKYKCDFCGESQVCGMEQALLMGKITILENFEY